MKKYIKSNSQNLEEFVINDEKDFEDVKDYIQRSPDYQLTGVNYNMITPRVKLVIPDDVLLDLFTNKNKTNFMYYLKRYVSPSDFKQFKARIEQMISSYDSWVFKSPKELVRDIADIINDNVDIAPYPIKVQVKPTSVYILIHLNDDEIATIDDAEFDAAIKEYVDWIRSLPEVGKVEDEQIYDYFRYSKRFPSRWPHLPIKVLPAVQR